MSFQSENVRSMDFEKSPNKQFAFNDSFHLKPEYQSPIPSYEQLQAYLEEALRKQISLQFMLGIEKIQSICSKKICFGEIKAMVFKNMQHFNSSDKSLNDEKEIKLLKEHLNEEIADVKSKKKEIEQLREKISKEPFDCFKDPNKLYEKMMQKQEELWSEFQKYKENVHLDPPKNEQLWNLLIKEQTEEINIQNVLYQYQEFLMQEHVKFDILRQHLFDESERIKNEQILLEKNRFQQIDYEIFEETKEKIKSELNEEKDQLKLVEYKLQKLFNVLKNYLYFKENLPFDWDGSLEDFLQEMNAKINKTNDIFEKDQKKKFQIKRLKEELQEIMDENSRRLLADPYEKHLSIMENVNNLKEMSQEEEIQRKLYKRKEEMLQHKQKELEALKKLLEKESIILQEEKIWLNNEKNKLGEQTKKKIESLKDENLRLREEIKFLKEQNPLQNISNIIPVNSDLKNKSILKEINNIPSFANQIKDEFQITEQIITNPQIRKMALFTLANWIDFSIDTNKSKPYIMKIFGFYKWKLHSYFKDYPMHSDHIQTIEDNTFLKKKWLKHQKNLILQKRYPYNALNKQRKNLEENFFDYERKRFWKNRFVQLFGSIFRNRRRREKIIYLVAFYKFCLHSLLHNPTNRKFVNKQITKNLIFDEKKYYPPLINNAFVEEPIVLFEKTKKAIKEREDKTKLSPKKIFDSPDKNYKSNEMQHSKNNMNESRKFASKNINENKEKPAKNFTKNNRNEMIINETINNSQRMKPVRDSQKERKKSINDDELIEDPSLDDVSMVESKDYNTVRQERKYQKDHNFNQKIKSAILICIILIRRSNKNSTKNKKAHVFMKWMRFNLGRERELMNEEFNDFNIILSEILCNYNQKNMNLRLMKSSLDSQINLLTQMITCLKVNIFQKNIKKIK